MHKLALALSLLLALPAHAEGWHTCKNLGTLINAQTMESTRSFDSTTVARWGEAQGFDLVVITVQLTDADTSITRLDVTCTVSIDGNTTNLTPQVESVAAGVATQTNAGVWQKASPGSLNWPIRMNVSGFSDFACSFAVGAGTGAAADLLTVQGRVCAL